MSNVEQTGLERRMGRSYFHMSGLSAKVGSSGGWANVLFNHPLVYVNGIALPQSTTYGWNQAVLVDSARNVQGVMIGAVIREDVAKIELTWNYLLREHIRLIGGISFINDVRFYYPPAGDFVTRRLYKSDFNGGTPLLSDANGSLDENGLPRGHDGVRIALIEI